VQCAETASPSIGDNYLSISLQLTSNRADAAVWEVEPIRVKHEPVNGDGDDTLSSLFPAVAWLPSDQSLVLRLWSRNGKALCTDGSSGGVRLLRPGTAEMAAQSDEWECNLVETAHADNLAQQLHAGDRDATPNFT
jgi:hypothetical protein